MVHLTQFDVAQRLGVSRKAVSFALSSDPQLNRKLRPATRERILETVQQMGYVPHYAGRRLAQARSDRQTSLDQVGLIFLTRPETRHSHVDPVCLAMMQGAEHELSKLHSSLTFVRVTESGDWQKVERLIRAGGVDGWLLYGAVNDEVVDRLKLGKLPSVVLGDHQCTQPVYGVNIDNRTVGRLAVEHLASLGHRRIAYMAGNMRFRHQEQILEAFRDRQKELGLDDDERLSTNLSEWREPGVNHPIGWLQSLDPMPTAVFMPDFGVALALYPVLQQAPVAVLKQISVLACGYASPQDLGQNFTSIELPMSEVGRQGALLLHGRASAVRVEPKEVKISPSLIEGRSTRPPGSNKPKTTNSN